MAEADLTLSVTLRRYIDAFAQQPFQAEALEIEGSVDGLRKLQALIEQVISEPGDGHDPIHVLHKDLPGVVLHPPQLYVTIRRVNP